MQSKQTEIIVARNDKLLEQIETLRREIEIHKDVEKELAKRSHFCQKVIKRQKIQITSFEKSPSKANGMRNSMQMPVPNNEVKGSEELISFLESKLESIERSFGKK